MKPEARILHVVLDGCHGGQDRPARQPKRRAAGSPIEKLSPVGGVKAESARSSTLGPTMNLSLPVAAARSPA